MRVGTRIGIFDSDGEEIQMGDIVVVINIHSSFAEQIVVDYKNGMFIDSITEESLYTSLEKAKLIKTEHQNKFLVIDSITCNFQTFNGLTHKCDLKLSTPKSKDRYPTCDGTECIFIK